MPKVLILTEPLQEKSGSGEQPAATVRMVAALKQAMVGEAAVTSDEGDRGSKSLLLVEQIVVSSVADLDSQYSREGLDLSEWLVCPLTLGLPEWMSFSAQAVYDACRNVEGLRQSVGQWGYETTATGDHWLPIVVTAKGPLYAEAIGLANHPKPPLRQAVCREPLDYGQPIHLNDSQRQPLYDLGYRLVRSLTAPPAVYLMQFGLQDQGIAFDRLMPFPDVPAIASLGRQTPDIFTCHWYCITQQPIRELTIC